jgi:hypothetical protein
MSYPHSAQPTVSQDDPVRPGWGGTTRLVVGILLIILFGIALRSFRAIIVPLIISTIMAYLLNPLVHSVSRMTRIPHKVATAIIYLILLAGVILLGVALMMRGLSWSLCGSCSLPFSCRIRNI